MLRNAKSDTTEPLICIGGSLFLNFLILNFGQLYITIIVSDFMYVGICVCMKQKEVTPNFLLGNEFNILMCTQPYNLITNVCASIPSK